MHPLSSTKPNAAAYFNKTAKENDLNFHAVFRGTLPDGVLTKETIIGLTEDKFDISDWKPQKVADQDVENAHKVITFDRNVPLKESSAPQEQWNGTPSISEDYEVTFCFLTNGKKIKRALISQRPFYFGK